MIPDPRMPQLAGPPKERRTLSHVPVRAGLWSVVLRLAGTAIALLVGIQLARYLGPAGLGQYALIVAIVMPLASIAQFGLPTLAVRELALGCEQRDDRRVRAVVFSFALVTLALSAVVGLALVGMAILFPSGFGPGAMLLLGALLLPFVALTGLIGAQLRGLSRLLRGQSLEIVARPAVMSLFLLLASATGGTMTPELALALTAASFGAAMILGLAWLHFALPASGKRWRQKGELRGWLLAAAPMAITDLLRQVEGVYALLVVGLLTTADETGIFRVAVSAIIIIAIPNSIMHVVMAPNLARLYARGDSEGLRAALSGSARIMFAALCAGSVVVALFGEWLLGTLFGAAFVPAWQALLILTGAHAVSAFFGLGSIFLAMTGRERPLAMIQFVAIAISAAAAFPLVERFGATGGAWSVLLGYSVSSALAWIAIRRQTGLDCSLIGLPPTGAAPQV